MGRWIEEKAFSKQMQRLFGAFPVKKWLPTEIRDISDSFYDVVGAFDLEAFQYAVSKAMLTTKFPTAGNMYSYCKDAMEQQDREFDANFQCECACDGDGWLPRIRILFPETPVINKYTGLPKTKKWTDSAGKEWEETIRTGRKSILMTMAEYRKSEWDERMIRFGVEYAEHARDHKNIPFPEKPKFRVNNCVLPCACREHRNQTVQRRGR